MKDTYILGISAYYHDSAACLIKNADIIAAAQEERFTRKKHDESFPLNAVNFCLEAAGITVADVSYVAFYEKPWIKFERLLETYLSFAPRGFGSFIKAMPVWVKEKLWMGDDIKHKLEYEGDICYPEHHESHAASAFFPSPFASAAVLTVDGVGEWATTTVGHGKENKINLLYEQRFPHSLGLLYSAFTYYTGFKVNSGEYKVMGLAPYGEPTYVQTILDNLIDIKEDGSFRLNQEYFDYCHGLRMTSEKFHQLFGATPRKPESKITQREMDLARSVQEVTELVMLKLARFARSVTGEKNLVMAGGVALNCVANGKILKEKLFENIWIQPASGDAGGALGAALFCYHHVCDGVRAVNGSRDSQKGSLLGPRFSREHTRKFLQEKKIAYHELGENLEEEVAKLLASGHVVGWFSGAMEYGPRALGARSILGDARNPEMQKTMNLKIKFRESFRPFAPACLREDVGEYFEINQESPYMLLVVPVVESRRVVEAANGGALFGIDQLNQIRSDIPAITHVDYSARVQTVDADSNPRFYKLLQKFKEQTGYGVLINTSFNVRGEPIVCVPEDAYLCFMRTNMDALVLDDFLLLKKEQEALKEDVDWQTMYELD